ncbi:uncharacterized protein LOC143485600 [Brachyhypopomus gauderio]|uniref:uncharacterized protein LOC143485600 n=1 Tax=Brachyhypopomus gauderio TaxID=698409 RepID=UPI004041397F
MTYDLRKHIALCGSFGRFLTPEGVKPGAINNMVITKPVPNGTSQGGVRSGLYRGMVTTVGMASHKPAVQCAFGMVQEGIGLSYQQPVLPSRHITLHPDVPSTPLLPLKDHHLDAPTCAFVCTEQELFHLKSLEVSLDMAHRIEMSTLAQA